MLNVKPATIFCRDNLEILRRINSNSVDLVYLDPPFNSGKDYHAPVGSQAEGASFTDIWTTDMVKKYHLTIVGERFPDVADFIAMASTFGGKSMTPYLTFMAVRLIEMHRILKPSGSLWLHCDQHADSYLQIILDGIFGNDNFVNQIRWCYSGQPNRKKGYSNKDDTILYYRKNFNEGTFRLQRKAMTDEEKANYRYRDDKGQYAVAVRGNKRYKSYLNPDGKPVVSWWDDIKILGPRAKERTGYRTQKPLRLLERILLTATEPGDIVLDPFCGCATTCVAAHQLNRGWIGIDVSQAAYRLVLDRLRDDGGNLPLTYFRDDLPERTDIGSYLKLTTKRKKEVRTIFYGEQEGNCRGCGIHQEIASNLTIDHIVPRAKGGTDHLSNLQLLCLRCNSIKGHRSMAYLLDKIKGS